MYSFALEVIFILLTSWAPIWVFWCGTYEFRDEYRNRSNACWECLGALLPIEHRVILLFYIPLYSLAIAYFSDMDKNSSLLGWLIGVYVAVTLLTISVADQRRGTSKRNRYSQIQIRGGDIYRRRRRFSAFSDKMELEKYLRKLEEKDIKRLKALQKTISRRSIQLQRSSMSPDEQDLLTLLTSRMKEIDKVLRRGSISPQEEADIFDESKELLLGNLPYEHGQPKLDF